VVAIAGTQLRMQSDLRMVPVPVWVPSVAIWPHSAPRLCAGLLVDRCRRVCQHQAISDFSRTDRALRNEDEVSRTELVLEDRIRTDKPDKHCVLNGAVVSPFSVSSRR